MLGTVDNMVAASSVGVDQVQSWEYIGQSNKQTTGMGLFKNNRQHKIVSIDGLGTVDMLGHPFLHVSPHLDRTILLSTLHGWANPGQFRTIFAIGTVTLKSSGNISLKSAGVPELTCPSGGAILLQRIIPQLGSPYEWNLISITPDYGVAPPADGFYYARGHRRFNNTAAIGQPPSWVNVAAGVATAVTPTTNFRALPALT
ncbi:hypothetical protein D3C71_1595190 [compost metagenome]